MDSFQPDDGTTTRVRSDTMDLIAATLAPLDDNDDNPHNPLQQERSPSRPIPMTDASSQEQQSQSQPLSHTPPASASYQNNISNFKRPRSGSISGRIRAATEYLDQKKLLDASTRMVLKDLIITGDPELQRAMDAYEIKNDASLLEEMISSGALQRRLPSDVDIMGDLDLDFLGVSTANDDQLEPLNGQYQQQRRPHTSSISSFSLGSSSVSAANHTLAALPDDGIGELDFNGDLGGDCSSSNVDSISDMERRMRSNSMFSALLNDVPAPKSGNSSNTSVVQQNQHPQNTLPTTVVSPQITPSSPIPIHNTRGSSAQQNHDWDNMGLDETWMEEEFDPMAMEQEALPEKPKRGRPRRKKPVVGGKQTPRRASIPADIATRHGEDSSKPTRTVKKRKDKKESTMDSDDGVEDYIPGSGRPRSLSDPNLQTTIDRYGLRYVERPDGWVGAYSPDSRRARVERFLAKRGNRVWTKMVKYDVRKNFADSRLRVKGRFVKKEEEVMMRELMSLS